MYGSVLTFTEHDKPVISFRNEYTEYASDEIVLQELRRTLEIFYSQVEQYLKQTKRD